VARYVQFSTIFFTTFYFCHLDLLPLSHVLFERARLHCDSCALVLLVTISVTHFGAHVSSVKDAFSISLLPADGADAQVIIVIIIVENKTF
jgi:hypothetical protein